MAMTIHFKSSPLFSKPSLCIERIGLITVPQRTNFASKARIFHSYPLLSHKAHVQKPIICSRKNRRGYGHQKLIKILPRVVTFMASNLKILPEPLYTVIEEYGGGGGGSGFWKGFGGGSFDGWRGKWRINAGLLVVLVVCGFGLLLLLFGGALKSDVYLGVPVLSLLGAVLIKGFKRGVKDWVLGLCLFGVLLCLGLKKEDMQKWIVKYGVRSPVLVRGKRKRRHGRRMF